MTMGMLTSMGASTTMCAPVMIMMTITAAIATRTDMPTVTTMGTDTDTLGTIICTV